MNETKLRAYILKLVCFFTIIMVFCIGADAFRDTRVKADGKVVKIGYVPSDNFIVENEGHYVGYCVDYLEEIAKYTGWTYEYVAGSWGECMQRVESGEIDFFSTVQYTEERAKKFIFSDESMGVEYGLIYARTDDEYYYMDYKNMDGCTLGMMSSTVFDERIDELEEIYSIKFKRVYFNTADETMEALKSGQTDLAMIGSVFGENSAKIVGRDDGKLYYCVTAKHNADLMDKFNEAIHKVKLNDASIEVRLYQKYYSEDKISSKPLFTREEAEFIASSSEVIVKLMTTTQPLCYKEDGRMAGIFVDYIKLLADKTGLKIRIEEVTTSELNEFTANLASSGYLTLRSKRVVEQNGLAEGLIRSDAIMDTKLSYVVRKTDVGKGKNAEHVFALTKEMEYYLPAIIKRESEKYQIKYYETVEECMNAVVDGEADIAVQDSYLTKFLMNKPKYEDKLTEVTGQVVTNGMCLIGSTGQEQLFAVINKAVAYISDEELTSVVDKELRQNTYQWDFEDFLYEYWKWVIAGVVVVIIIFGTYAIQLRRMTKMQIKKKDYDTLQEKVQQDELTGVYNKQYFYKKATEMITNTDKEMCIVMMDVTNFKMINDMFGLENGDKLLCYLAQDLIETCEGKDILLARFNADHFYMCMSVEDFKSIYFTSKYRRTPVENIDVRVSYGIFMVGEHKDVPVNIMCDRASIAIHESNEKGDEYMFYYTDKDHDRKIRQQEIERDMEGALERREFCVYIQPKYDVHKKRVIGGEALARWKHPEKGMISPADFIPVFEKNGFIRFLDYYIWEETCKLIAAMKRQGFDRYPISINVSRAHFYRNEFQHVLKELIEKYKLLPDDVELEITESIYVEDSEIIISRIQELRKMGFKVAMDDFGSGYSSLNMLKEMPIDIIKMDLKFLDSSENVDKSHKILDSLVDLAKRLELNVVIEGVETEEQVEFLQGIGEMTAQGYYFSKPLEKRKYEELLILDNIT